MCAQQRAWSGLSLSAIYTAVVHKRSTPQIPSDLPAQIKVRSAGSVFGSSLECSRAWLSLNSALWWPADGNDSKQWCCSLCRMELSDSGVSITVHVSGELHSFTCMALGEASPPVIIYVSGPCCALLLGAVPALLRSLSLSHDTCSGSDLA